MNKIEKEILAVGWVVKILKTQKMPSFRVVFCFAKLSARVATLNGSVANFIKTING